MDRYAYVLNATRVGNIIIGLCFFYFTLCKQTKLMPIIKKKMLKNICLGSSLLDTWRWQ